MVLFPETVFTVSVKFCFFALAEIANNSKQNKVNSFKEVRCKKLNKLKVFYLNKGTLFIQNLLLQKLLLTQEGELKFAIKIIQSTLGYEGL